MNCDYTANRIIPLGNSYTRMLDNSGPRSFIKIYCACGRIVDLDRRAMNVKKSLKKELECTGCRNARISMEIDILNNCSEEDLSNEYDPLY